MKPLPDKYEHTEAETRWQKSWEESAVYRWESDFPRAQTYVIDTPPPTVSGMLHMGHVFSYTQADFIARYQRMSGKTVFYPMGFDDNGLPTERLVEKTRKVRAADMSREEFIAQCLEVSEEARRDFRSLFTSIALSIDWNEEYHTVSDRSRRISQMSFLDLFRKNHAYRQLQPMLWDPVDQTAIAQAEVEDKELEGRFCDIEFEVVDGEKPSPSGRGLGEGKKFASEKILSFARELRKQATDAEKLLWAILRNRQIGGIKFRRQHPMEQYIADFYSHEARLVIELDGGQHNEEAAEQKDIARTAYLEQSGCKILRFWNHEVLENIEGVVSAILEALTPTLSQGEREFIVIGTTRPEMIPACVAVFYHPDDERYKHLKGKFAVTPLFGVRVPIMEDDTVEPEKGTGIMMCCTFGDEADIEKWRKHGLPMRMVLNKYGKMDFSQIQESVDEGGSQPCEATNYCEQLEGLKAKAARDKMIELLTESGELVGSTPITHAVKCAERSGAPLEILPTYQWFVKVLDQKEALKAKAAECNWYPAYMKVRMDQWIDGLNWDWCISRQRYFGVPFPVWYSKRPGEEGKILVASPEQMPVNPLADLPAGYSREEVEPDMDVMDTWATSSVSPQLSSGSITDDLRDGSAERHAKLFPADLRPQAHEIIRTWAFYTLVKAHLHENSIPWENLMISGWCLASDKTKMSKSKGNVVTPVELVRDKGADVVRYWASTSKLGADTAFSEDVLKIGRKLVNKLWNATKFAAIHLEHLKEKPKTAREEVENGTISQVLDRWVLTRLQRAIAKATQDFEKYEYSDARNAAEDFFWNDFCDNYLELVKSRIYGNEGDTAAQMSAVHTIYHCLNGVLRLFAPFVPHVTEELFSYIFDEDYATHGSVHVRHMWPLAADYPCDADAEEAGKDCVGLLEAVRKLKSERNVSIKYPLDTVSISVQQIYAHEPILKEALIDLKGASNAAQVSLGIMQGDHPSRIATTTTEDGKFTLSALFAEQSDVA